MPEPSPTDKKKSPLAGFGDPIRIIVLVAAAIAGLLFSSGYILSNSQKRPFHEISWNAKEVVQALVSKGRAKTDFLADSLKEKRRKALDKKREWWNKTDTDAAIIKKTKTLIDSLQTKTGYLADSVEEVQLKALDDIQQWLNTKSDTIIRSELSKNTSIYIHTRNLSLNNYSFVFDKDSFEILNPCFVVTHIDSDLVGGQITDSITLRVNRYGDTERFFNKYPGFALWSLLLIVQATFFSILIAGFLFHFLSASANSLYKDHLEFKPGKTLILLGGMLAFVLTIFFTLLSDEKSQLASGKLFMLTMHDFFFFVNMLGHTAAALCLVGMINSVMYMNQLKNNAEKPGMEAVVIEKLRTEIKRRFNAYFVFIGIILSLAILTSGVFYSSMNGLEFVKQVRKDQGFSPVNTDMVYIYGILNSFFLLLVYLPLRYILVSLDKSIPLPTPVLPAGGSGNETDPKPGDKKDSVLSKLFNALLSMDKVLVTVSPFLVSLLQDLLNSIFS